MLIIILVVLLTYFLMTYGRCIIRPHDWRFSRRVNPAFTEQRCRVCGDTRVQYIGIDPGPAK